MRLNRYLSLFEFVARELAKGLETMLQEFVDWLRHEVHWWTLLEFKKSS